MPHSTILAACLLAAASPAMAAAAVPDCSDLAAARSSARVAAAPLAYQVFDLDGDNAHAFEQAQGVLAKDQVDHLTIMVNPKTGRSAALVNDGPKCAFASVLAVLAPNTPPIDSALDILRLAR